MSGNVVVGSGYVGSDTGAVLVAKRYQVTAIDARQQVVDSIDRGEVIVNGPVPADPIRQSVAEGQHGLEPSLPSAQRTINELTPDHTYALIQEELGTAGKSGHNTIFGVSVAIEASQLISPWAEQHA